MYSITSSDGKAILPPDAVLPGGSGQFTVTLNTAGSQTITATDTSNSSVTGTSQTVVTSPSAAGRIAFVQQPGTTKAGISIAPAPSVQVTDRFGNSVPNVSVTLSLANGTGALSGAAIQTTNASGTATFTGVSVNHPGQKTFGAAAAGNLTAASSPFTVTASDTLTVKGIGITATAGSPFTGPVATVTDTNGASPASDFTTTVNWGDGSTTPGAVSGSSPFTITGSHTYSAAGSYTAIITVTDTQPGNVSASGTSTATVTSATAGPPILHTFAPGLQMFSVTESYPSSFVAFGGQSPRLMIWNPAQLQYNTVTSLVPGQSYWVRLTQSTPLYDTGTPASMNAPFAIALSTGWNMISSPFFTARGLSAITVRDTLGVQGTFGQAVGAGVLSGTLYTYPGGAVQYQTLGQDGTLAPYNGYWLYAFKPCTLLVPTN